jgi:hypothetical protein
MIKCVVCGTMSHTKLVITMNTVGGPICADCREKFFLEGANTHREPIYVKHADLERSGLESMYRSKCPTCKVGHLMVLRDQHTLEISNKDNCTLCGQHFIYTDIGEQDQKHAEGKEPHDHQEKHEEKTGDHGDGGVLPALDASGELYFASGGYLGKAEPLGYDSDAGGPTAASDDPGGEENEAPGAGGSAAGD